MTRVPSKLNHPPIVESYCEVRFQPSAVDATHIPLILYSELQSEFPHIETLPMAQLPAMVRNSDPSLAYAPTYRFSGEGKSIFIGERAVLFSRVGPYPGWGTLKDETARVFGKAIPKFSAIVERVSVKYVNFIQAELGSDQLSLTNIKVVAGGLRIDASPILLRTEVKQGNLTAVIQIVAQAQMQGSANEQKSGLVIDVDAIAFGHFDGIESVMVALDSAHGFEKEVFFNLLSPESLAKFEPTY